ncbi:MAG TPA: DUF1344 domain-containing protein [Rhizobiaceae bacterium]|nr:DUF1344 domain-containing protein [Rhizobiaceae bacterium]
MRIILAATIALFLAVLGANAESAEGKIRKVNADAMTVVLEDGKTYKLPPEMDVTVLAAGTEILIAYEVNKDGVNQITDMEVLE